MLVTVEIPKYAPSVVAALILTSPILENTLWITSPLKVLAVETVPWIDLTSFVLYEVDPAEILPLSIPLKINCSPVIKFPLVL